MGGILKIEVSLGLEGMGRWCDWSKIGMIAPYTTDSNETNTNTASGSSMPRTERFKYSGSILLANGELR